MQKMEKFFRYLFTFLKKVDIIQKVMNFTIYDILTPLINARTACSAESRH